MIGLRSCGCNSRASIRKHINDAKEHYVSKPAATIRPVHFDDFSGNEFERLVFAYQLRMGKWRSLEWYGQSGSDLGRDIWGEREDGGTLCVQCVNRKIFTATKVI